VQSFFRDLLLHTRQQLRLLLFVSTYFYYFLLTIN
jgi:hypothetical protein